MGYVYLLGDSERDGYYKIGVTRGSIEKRIKKLQTGNSSEIFLINSYETENPFIIESRLHLKFHKEKELNEWFKLEDGDVFKFIEYCKEIEEILKSVKDNHYLKKKIK